MPHVFEPAPTGRAKCRGCGQAIARGDVRFGERLPNPFADGEMTLWFHPLCAAYKRPEAVLQALAESSAGVADAAGLEKTARAMSAHRRLQRIDGVERAASGRAKCRSCRQPIEREAWRIRLVYFEEGRFTPGGYVHLDCRGDHFEGHFVLAPALHFSPDLSDEDRAELTRLSGLDAGRTAAAPPTD